MVILDFSLNFLTYFEKQWNHASLLSLLRRVRGVISIGAGTGTGVGYGCWVRVRALGTGVGYGSGVGYCCWVRLLGTVTGIGIGYLYRCWVRVRVLDRCLGAGTVPMYRTHVPHYPCTVPIVPMYRTHRTHHTYPASDRSSNRFFEIKTIFIEPF